MRRSLHSLRVIKLRTISLLAIGLFAVAATACGGDSDPGVSSDDAGAVESATDAQPTAGPISVDPDPIPFSLASSAEFLTFQARTILSLAVPGDESTRLGSVTVPVPLDWPEDPALPGRFLADPEDFVAIFDVGSSCGGACRPRSAAEWLALAQEAEFEQFRDTENFEILLEDALPDGRLVVADNSFGNRSLAVARWLSDRSEYFFCRFSTSEPDQFNLEQFASACTAALIDDLPTSSRSPTLASDHRIAGLVYPPKLTGANDAAYDRTTAVMESCRRVALSERRTSESGR